MCKNMSQFLLPGCKSLHWELIWLSAWWETVGQCSKFICLKFTRLDEVRKSAINGVFTANVAVLTTT